MNISIENKSYITGFLHGDGHHVKNGPIQIQISIRDIDILDKIETILIDVTRNKRTYDTNFKKNYTECSMRISKKGIVDCLDVPVGKKSDKIEPPKDVNLSHYLRGLYDADGSIGITANNRPFLSLCTSSEKIKEIVLWEIEKYTGFEKHINRNKRDGVYNIAIFDEDAIIYSSILYQNATIYLDRKYKKFIEICKWKRTVPKKVGRKKKWLSYEDKFVMTALPLEDKMKILNRTIKSIKMRIWRLKQK